jgi:hypothetical protein
MFQALMLKAYLMRKGMNGIRTNKVSHGIATKVPIQSGNASKRKTIEASTESARTGILSANTMVVGSVVVQYLSKAGNQLRHP